MTKFYLQVRDWNTHFENNRTRELKNLSWFPAPNHYDGYGYTELMDHENGPSHYAAWLCIVGIASKCDVRGTLLRKGPNGTSIPHDERSFSRITRIGIDVFEEAIPRLIQIGWLERIPLPDNDIDEIPQVGAGLSQDDAGIPQDVAPRVRAGACVGACAGAPAEGKEGKGTEGKGRESSRQLRFDEEDSQLASWMFGLIQEMQPDRKPPNFDSWANTFRLIREQDGRAPPEIRQLFEWCNRDSFWRTNILSPDKLREKWDDLQLKRMNERNGTTPKLSPGKTYDPNATCDLE
jgi:hypothetical protein